MSACTSSPREGGWDLRGSAAETSCAQCISLLTVLAVGGRAVFPQPPGALATAASGVICPRLLRCAAALPVTARPRSSQICAVVVLGVLFSCEVYPLV